MANAPILVTASQCPWSQRAVADATRFGLGGRVVMASMDQPANRAWFKGLGGSVTPTLIVVNPSGSMGRIEGYPGVSAQFQAWAGAVRPAGQVAAGPAKTLQAPQYAIYVSSTCGACAKALQMIGTSPTLLQKIEVRKLDGNPKAILEMHDLGATRTPALVALDPAGNPTGRTFEGPAAWLQIVSLA